jgi:hypothetical protein
LFGLDCRFWLLRFRPLASLRSQEKLMFMSTVLLRAMSLGFESELDWGRVAYWDPRKGAVVISDPGGISTVFTPRDGADYFWNVLE